MTPSLNSLLLYTKLLTALVIILNIGLILLLRSHISWGKQLAAVAGEQGKQFLKSKLLLGLIFLVIAINAAAVFANHNMLKSIKEIQKIAAEMPQR